MHKQRTAMKAARPCSLFAILSLTFLAAACAARHKPQPGEPAPVIPMIETAAAPVPARDDGQRLHAAAAPILPQQRHASEIITDFRPVYEKLGSPRLVFHINRDIAGAAPRRIIITPTSSGRKIVVINDGGDTFSVESRQAMRDIERTAAQPFIQAGATLADRATVATESAQNAGLVAIETLVTSRRLALPSLSDENAIVTVPDIQMTAIRLSDAAIIGQATANDIINQLPPAELGRLDAQDALEATALNLMNDITARAR